MYPLDILVVGAGVFGASAALSLVKRGHRVRLLEQGQVPHPLAASTDLSKAVRGDYGRDSFYTELHRACWPLWQRSPFFHPTGMMFLSRRPLSPGSFEYESVQVQERLGGTAERLRPVALAARFPAWNAAVYPDGYFNPQAGWVESARFVQDLVEQAVALGVRRLEDCPVEALDEVGGRVAGVLLRGGERLRADLVVCALGAFSPLLMPWLGERLKAVGQPVFHFRPADPRPFEGRVFPVWAADISSTGWYGFPANADGLVKVARHGPGRVQSADAPREVDADEEHRFRAFLRESLPSLADAPVEHTRLCLYTDTFDGDFLIDRDPDRPGLVVATGGSGHALKFAPLLGEIIADAALGVDSRWRPRFAWRAAPHPGSPGAEAARFTGTDTERH